MKNKPLISIITVSYNAATTLEETILSVINQTYSNIEYIIIDGGSTDGTTDIIKKYSTQISYWVSEPDKGIYDAMNKGALIATGDYIQYLNASDRIYTNDTIEKVVSQLPKNEIDVIYGDIIVEKEFGKFHLTPRKLISFHSTFPIYHPSTWVKRDILVGKKFNTNFKIAADFNLLREIYFDNQSFLYIPIIFSIFEGYNGISSNAIYKNWVECQKIIQEDKNKFWPIKKFMFYTKDRIRTFYYKIMSSYKKDFKIKREYNYFIKDERIKKVLELNENFS